jgi:tetratricopeptide (TPR) repeat protein
MKSFALLSSCCLVLSIASLSAHAAGTYAESLAAADKALGAQQNEGALSELATALSQSTTPGERALALAKKGYVLAFAKQDYAGARPAVEEALKVDGLAPVAKVTALQVLAECQIKAEKNFSGAMGNLQSALTLEGVDWAKPALTMSLADCHRSVGDLEQAMASYRRVLDLADAGPDLKAGAHLNIGFIYQYDRKDFAKAKEAYGAAVALRPNLQTEVNGHIGRMSDL